MRMCVCVYIYINVITFKNVLYFGFLKLFRSILIKCPSIMGYEKKSYMVG
jgi:hypothetical protein